jgi:hypothetical protein
MTTTLTCSVAADLHNKIRMLKTFWQKACKIFTKEHNKLWNHDTTCNDFMAHIYSPIQKDDTTVCINTKVSLIYRLSGLQSINHNAVVPIINISCWDTHHFSVNSMILWYRFPVVLKQQNITICEDPTVLINELQSYMAWTHVLWQTGANTTELAASILYTENRGSFEMFVSIDHTTHFHTAEGCSPKPTDNLQHKIE